MKYKVGDTYPVWWETKEQDENGQNLAVILEIMPYGGRYTESFDYIFRLSCPPNICGYAEMAIPKHGPKGTSR